MVVKNKKFELECINKSRVILLGIATLLVTIFHSGSLNFQELINIKFISNILNFIQKTGNYGVDIFLFLSGIGLYHSLSKNNLKQYYKNRFIRIIPIFYIIVLAYTIITETYTIKDFFETIFLISFFIKGNLDIWYIPFIIIIYLIFPLIYKLIKKYDIAGLLISLLSVITLNLLYSICFPTGYHNIEIALTRIPVFLIGVFFGKMIYNKQKISPILVIASILTQLLISFIIYMNLDIPKFHIFSRYLYCPLAISTVINISMLFSLIKNDNILILKPLKFIGNHSLEIYLIYELVKKVINASFSISSYTRYYLLCFIITIILSHILKQLINKIIYFISNLYYKKTKSRFIIAKASVYK